MLQKFPDIVEIELSIVLFKTITRFNLQKDCKTIFCRI